jgi:hypothetical protein
LVIDAAGYIVAANERAAELLGRKAESLPGQFFGVWGPDIDLADLDLIRIRNGQAESIGVRARRYSVPQEESAYGHTSILFEPLPPPQVPLAVAVGLTALEVPAVNLNLSFASLPENVHVGPEFEAMVRAWVIFFRNTADNGKAELRIRASAESDNLELELCLHQPDPPPLRSEGYETDDLEQAAVSTEKLGGSFQLRVDYPNVVATIRVAHENRTA